METGIIGQFFYRFSVVFLTILQFLSTFCFRFWLKLVSNIDLVQFKLNFPTTLSKTRHCRTYTHNPKIVQSGFQERQGHC